MGRIIEFDLCAIAILVVILIATFVRKATKGYINHFFIALVILLLVTACADFAAESINNAIAFRNSHLVLLYLCNYVYLILRNAMGILYIFFLYVYMQMGYRFRAWWLKICFSLPYIALLVLIATNPIHHFVFRVTAENGYQRGPLIMALYIVSIFYAVYGTVYLISCKRFTTLVKWLGLASVYFLTFFAVFFQLYHERYQVEMFMTAIGLLIIILFVLRPEEITDPAVGLLSFKAYQAEIYKITEIKKPVMLVVVRFMNAWKIRSYLGEEDYNTYIIRISEQIEQFRQARSIRGDIYYETPGSLYLIIDEKYADFDVENVIPVLYEKVEQSIAGVQESGVRLEAKVCVIHCPNDVSSYQDILNLGHDFYGLVAPEQRFVRASDIVGTDRYTIGNQLDTILNRAIRDRHFEMYYQPIYSIKEGCFRSAEALIRLRDSKFGMISPGYFIPAAEDMGLIVAIGDFVMDAVYRFIATHDLKALGLSYIEINLSVAQCRQKELPKKIRALQKKYGVNPKQVNLEILETTYDDIGNIAEQNIKKLADMGYSFSLDDYGTGYSNIRRVSTLPLKIVKMDKSFVDGLCTEKGTSILTNTVRMMKEIDKELVVEGVETEEAVDALCAMKCDYIQGYYYSKPLPEEEFVQFLQKFQGRKMSH